MNEMFCFQCQQTAHNTGCEGKVGVCGKKSDTSNYQDEIVGALIALANEQKAVCILLTLLYLGIKNMYLGPTIPAFVSNGVIGYSKSIISIIKNTMPLHITAGKNEASIGVESV